MPYWLALGIWTGVVAQFVPTIGTYIAIALPVVVGLLEADPSTGVLALIFALIYQQIENLTIEPRISADAVDDAPCGRLRRGDARRRAVRCRPARSSPSRSRR